MNHSLVSAPHFVSLPCGCPRAGGKLGSPLHLKGKRKSPYAPSLCKYSSPPFKICADSFLLLCFKAAVDTGWAEACCPRSVRSWGFGLGALAGWPCRLGCCGQHGPDHAWAPATAPDKALQKNLAREWLSGIPLSCYSCRGLSRLFILWEKSAATVSFAYLVLSEVISFPICNISIASAYNYLIVVTQLLNEHTTSIVPVISHTNVVAVTYCLWA